MASWLDNYNTRRKLVIDNTKISADLFNFPYDVILRSTNFDFTKSTANGNDIRFCEANGITQLNFERERHDNVALKAEYKTRLPFISSAAPTDSFLYYKNDPSIPDGQNPTAVWDTATKARWSLKEDPSGVAPQMKDSTINANHGTTFGMTAANSVEGKIGRALDLDGGNDFVDIGRQPELAPANITLEAWAKAFAIPSWAGVVTNKVGANHGINLQIGTVQNIAALIGDGTSFVYVRTTWAPVANTWYHIVITYNDTNDLNILYVDGVEEARATFALIYDRVDPLTQIGNFYTTPSILFNGLIDEVRIYNRALSAAEIKAQFEAGNNTLLTYGGQESRITLTGALAFSGVLTRTLLKTLTGILTFTGTLTRTLLKTLTGILTFTGTLTRTLILKRILTGALIFTGTLTRILTFKRILTGILTFKGKVFSPPSFKESDVTNVKLEEDRSKEVEKREL